MVPYYSNAQWYAGQMSGPQRAQASADSYNLGQMNQMGSQRFQTDEQIRAAQAMHPMQMQLAMAGKMGGYLSSGQAARARGRFDNTNRMIGDQENTLRGRQEQGLFNPDELEGLQALLGQSYGDARNLTQTGGADENYEHGATGMRENLARLNQTAEEGMFRPGEVEQMLASAFGEQQAAHKSAAESAYSNNLGASVAPFAAANIITKGASEAGRARANTNAAITAQQAESRQTAANQAGGLANALGEMSINLGRNKLAGMGEQNRASAAILEMLTGHAGGRMKAGDQLNDLIGHSGDIASQIAKLDAQEVPDFMRDLWKKINGDVARSKTQHQNDMGRATMFTRQA